MWAYDVCLSGLPCVVHGRRQGDFVFSYQMPYQILIECQMLRFPCSLYSLQIQKALVSFSGRRDVQNTFPDWSEE